MKKYFAILWIQKPKKEKRKIENSVAMKEIERDSNRNLLAKFLMQLTMMKKSYLRKKRQKRQRS
jgi:hypothetical protein